MNAGMSAPMAHFDEGHLVGIAAGRGVEAPQHAPGKVAGVEMSIRIGQRVRHQDYQGQRVTGVVQGLAVDDRALMVDIVLDVPIVIPAMGEYGPTKIYRQHVPAHELAPFDDRDELIAELLSVVREMVEMMDKGDEHGAGSEWHTKAVAAISKTTGGAS